MIRRASGLTQLANPDRGYYRPRHDHPCFVVVVLVQKLLGRWHGRPGEIVEVVVPVDVDAGKCYHEVGQGQSDQDGFDVFGSSGSNGCEIGG